MQRFSGVLLVKHFCVALLLGLSACNPSHTPLGEDLEPTASKSNRQDRGVSSLQPKLQEETFATQMQLPDGSFYYVLSVVVLSPQEICIPKASIGGGMLASGIFVKGRKFGGEEFYFVPGNQLEAWESYKIETERRGIDIDFRSTFDADELKAEIPFAKCSETKDPNWNYRRDGFLTSDWSSTYD